MCSSLKSGQQYRDAECLVMGGFTVHVKVHFSPPPSNLNVFQQMFHRMKLHRFVLEIQGV